MRCLTSTTLLASLAAMPALSWAERLDDRLPVAQRIQAATGAAQQAASCVAARPFYWEIGDAHHVLASGQVGKDAPGARTPLALASASKWIYGAYVAERRHGALSELDVRYLTFQSGHTRFRTCVRLHANVGDCQSALINGRGAIDPATVGRFDYSGGHMQQHATLMGLGPLGNEQLAKAIESTLDAAGPDWRLSYSQPQLAGGGVGTAAGYGGFLRAMLRDDLKMGALLGTHAVCANPTSCPRQATRTPIPLGENWHYSIGHWVEDDPVVGDGAFSSPGAFGFYPWVDAGKVFYGVLAREDRRGIRADSEADGKPAMESVRCGRAIRSAWMSGKIQP